MGDGMLALTWNNHSTTFFKTLSTVRVKERYTDVTLSCGGKFYQLHKLVLSTCSEYFEKIFEQTPCKHPVIVLRDVSCDELEALLNYMYLGSVSVAQNDLSRLIKVAELFQIKGLAVPDEEPKHSEIISNRKNDNRDRSSNQRGSAFESNRTRPSVSESPDAPLPKRSRTNESFMSAEQISQSAKSVPQNKELSRLGEGIRSQGITSDDAAGCGGEPESSATVPGSTYGFHVNIKEEIIHDISDSDSNDHSSRGGFDPIHDPDSKGAFDPLHEDSQGVPPFIPKTEPQDIPPDEQSLTQPVLGQESYNENVLALPGPSDAQGWYSEGDTSGGLPVSEGSIGDKSQEMLSLDASQQQQMVGLTGQTITDERVTDGGGSSQMHNCMYCSFSSFNKYVVARHIAVHTGEKPYKCPYCPSSFSQQPNMIRHMRVHTGEKPYSCTMCSFSSAQSTSLQSHIKRKHAVLIPK